MIHRVGFGLTAFYCQLPVPLLNQQVSEQGPGREEVPLASLFHQLIPVWQTDGMPRHVEWVSDADNSQ